MIQEFNEVSSSDSFVELASQLGEVIPNADGAIIKVLSVKEKHQAVPGTLSATFGSGRFPFHSDGAYMRTPPRWLLMRFVAGDTSRSTWVLSFNDFFAGVDQSDLRNAVWGCSNGVSGFLAPLVHFAGQNDVRRYDPMCMTPKCRRARRINSILIDRAMLNCGIEICWRINKVVLLNNWETLHSRGASESSSFSRSIERIYLK